MIEIHSGNDLYLINREQVRKVVFDREAKEATIYYADGTSEVIYYVTQVFYK